MQDADDVYFDRVSQIRMERWTRGRAALIGDAAACVSLWPASWAPAAGDYAAAFSRYEQRPMPFIRRKQESAARFASSFAPKSELGISLRNLASRLLRIPFVADFFIGRSLRDDLELPAFRFPQAR